MSTKSKLAVADPYWWTVINAGWFGVLVGALIGLAGLYAAWVFYKRAKPRPSVKTTSVSTQIVGLPEEPVEGKLQILFNEEIVPQVTSTVVGLWNDGTTIFRAEDVVLKDPIKIGIKDGKVLQATVDSVSRDVINALVKQSDEHGLLISFDFLEPGDALTVRVLHSGAPGDVELSGTLIGLPVGLQRFRPGRRGAVIEHYVDRIFALLGASFLIGITWNVWAENGWRKGLLVPVALCALFGTMAAIIWFMDRLSRRWTKNVPTAILGNSQLRSRLELEKAFQTASGG